MARLIDKSKKKNVKCEYCAHFSNFKCLVDGRERNYWNRCKNFSWSEEKKVCRRGRRGQ